ncbi:hypothetical protein DFQ26_000668, partial [Actinomortierella ambigua]
MYSILCVQRGQLVESLRQYDSDEEDLAASRRLLWPDRGDGRSFETLEDYEDDEEYHPMTLEQIRKDIDQRARAAQLAPRSVLAHMERMRRQQKSSNVVYNKDFFEEEVVEAHDEALLCKTAPRDSALDLGYCTDDEDLHRSETVTPPRRTPGLPSTGPLAYSQSGHSTPTLLFVVGDGDDSSSDDSDGAGHRDKVCRSVHGPMSDTALIVRRQDSLYHRGTQSCRLGKDPSNPFRPTPSTTEDVESDLMETSCRRVCDPAEILVEDDRDNSHPPSPTFHRSMSIVHLSNNEDEEDEEDEDDKEDDEDKQDPTWRSPSEPELDFGASILAARPLVQAQPPPYPFLPGSSCKHPRDDGGDEGERRDGKRRRQEP